MVTLAGPYAYPVGQAARLQATPTLAETRGPGSAPGLREAWSPTVGTFHPEALALVQLSTASVTSLAPLTQNFEVPQAWLQTGVSILTDSACLDLSTPPTLGVQRFASLRSPQPGGDRETIEHRGRDVAPGKSL